jgi:hypothetical protein
MRANTWSWTFSPPSELAAGPSLTGASLPASYNPAMPASRRRRLATVLFALFSMLFMQLALAGYACPGLESRVQEAAAMAESGMPCENMSMSVDDEQPALCHAHCGAGQQATDNQPVQMPAAVLVSGLAVTPAPVATPARHSPHSSLLARATAPPLAIRNCCFRI